MPYELCTTYDENQGKERALNTWPRFSRLLTDVDMALDWITERLDRKFVSAMERCVNEDPNRHREMKLLKRTVLVLLCVGLGITVVSIKFAVEAQAVYAVFG